MHKRPLRALKDYYKTLLARIKVDASSQKALGAVVGCCKVSGCLGWLTD